MKLYGGLPYNDLCDLSERISSLSDEILHSNFVIVGATGFLGRWLSASLSYMSENDIFLGSLTLMSRNERSLNELKPDLNVKLIKSVSTTGVTKEDFLHFNSDRTVVIFAATSTSESGKSLSVSKQNSTELAKKVVDSLPTSDNTFVHLSSGGIYEKNSRLLKQIPKDHKTQTKSLDSYIHEKISLENWSTAEESAGRLNVRNPRLFSFYGPGLQLDRHFVIGEFVKRARLGLTIEIKGNPANLRSYLYPSEAVMQILEQCGTSPAKYSQIGSGIPYSILQIAETVANFFNVEYRVSNHQNEQVDNYVPQDVPTVRERSIQEGIKVWDSWLKESVL
jgi:nucleoside-diphosphate-sugar epimerase